MATTHVFRLPSGVEAEVTELTGIHQRILTENTSKPHIEKMNELLHSLLVRVGSVNRPSIEFVNKMLSVDRKYALVQARQFTMDFDPLFKFKYTYSSEDGGIKHEKEMEVDLSDGFSFTPYKKRTPDGELVDAIVEDYEAVERTRTLVLPRSQQKVTFTLLDGTGEKKAAAIPKAARSSHSSIVLRNPVYMHQTEKGETPIQLDLDKLGLKDIEALRAEIKACEAQLDTEVMFPHPEAEKKQPGEKEVTLDLLGTVAFFFPSEAI